MSSHLAACMGLTVLLLFAFAQVTCARAIPITSPHQRLAYTLDFDANNDDWFCVKTAPGPLILAHEVGLHCTKVIAIRKFVASIKLADE